MAYGLICTVVLVISSAFAYMGVWFVFGFGLIEIAALGIALYYYARHATDQEQIALSADCLLIEWIEAGQHLSVTLDPTWTRIVIPDRRRTLIALESKGVKVEVGAFVSEQIRRRVATELHQQLRRHAAR